MVRGYVDADVEKFVTATEALGKHRRHSSNAKAAIQICLADVGVCNLTVVHIHKAIQCVLNGLTKLSLSMRTDTPSW